MEYNEQEKGNNFGDVNAWDDNSYPEFDPTSTIDSLAVDVAPQGSSVNQQDLNPGFDTTYSNMDFLDNDGSVLMSLLPFQDFDHLDTMLDSLYQGCHPGIDLQFQNSNEPDQLVPNMKDHMYTTSEGQLITDVNQHQDTHSLRHVASESFPFIANSEGVAGIGSAASLCENDPLADVSELTGLPPAPIQLLWSHDLAGPLLSSPHSPGLSPPGSTVPVLEQKQFATRTPTTTASSLSVVATKMPRYVKSSGSDCSFTTFSTGIRKRTRRTLTNVEKERVAALKQAGGSCVFCYQRGAKCESGTSNMCRRCEKKFSELVKSDSSIHIPPETFNPCIPVKDLLPALSTSYVIKLDVINPNSRKLPQGLLSAQSDETLPHHSIKCHYEDGTIRLKEEPCCQDHECNRRNYSRLSEGRVLSIFDAMQSVPWAPRFRPLEILFKGAKEFLDQKFEGWDMVDVALRWLVVSLVAHSNVMEVMPSRISVTTIPVDPQALTSFLSDLQLCRVLEQLLHSRLIHRLKARGPQLEVQWPSVALTMAMICASWQLFAFDQHVLNCYWFSPGSDCLPRWRFLCSLFKIHFQGMSPLEHDITQKPRSFQVTVQYLKDYLEAIMGLDACFFETYLALGPFNRPLPHGIRFWDKVVADQYENN